MIAKILELLTGKDDLERVAYKNDLALLNEYLRRRRVWVPRRPKRFLDAATFTQEEFLEMVEEDAKELSSGEFDPWILELDGINRLPVFSSQTKMEAFSARISQDMQKVFSLGCIEVLLADITRGLDIDIVDLNLFNRKSWEIGMRKASEM